MDATVSIADGCTNPTNGDVWYSFTAEEGFGYVINEPSFNTATASLYVAEDGDCDNLTEVIGCTTFFNTFSISEPGDYFFRIRAYSTQISHSVGLICAEIPANDEACNATLLECGDNLSGQSFVGATQSFDDACSGSGTADVWYTFVTDGTQAVTVAETETDVVVDLWTGDDCGNLVDISGCVDFGENFTVTDAGTYYFRIRPWGSAATYGVSLTCVDFATNDEACTATVLECGDVLSGQTFIGSTQSFDDACGGSGTNDVWFTFVSDGSQALTIAETETDVVVDLWSGDDCGNLTQVSACADFPESFSVNEAGTYYFRIRPWSTATSYGVSLTCADFATNDEACDAIALECGDELTGQSFAGGTQSFDDGCFGSGTADVWYSFVADGTQAYEIAETSTSDVVVDLWTGDECGNLTNVFPCDDFPENFEVSAAGTYYFRVRPYSTATIHAVSLTCSEFDCPELGNIGNMCDDGDAGTVNDVITDNCECVGTPQVVNDEACTATLLECGDDLSNQPFAGSSQSFDDACFGSGTGDVWYTFVADGTQTYLIAETETDVVVDLWSGDDCGNLTAEEGCVDFGENFTVTEAGTYYFRIRPYGTATTYGVSLTCTPFDCPGVGNIGDACDDGDESTANDVITENCECLGTPTPPNNDCVNAIALDCDTPTSGTTIGGTQSGIASPACSGGSLVDVFYTLDIEPGVEYTVSVNGPSFDGVLVLYSGECGTLVEEACADNGLSDNIAETITFTTDVAETITIRVYDWSTTNGDFTIEATCVSDNAAVFNGTVGWNSNCDDRISTVTFYEPNTSNVAATYETTVNSAGEFTIESVLVGTYDIIVDVPGYLNKGLADVATVVGENTVDFGTIRGGDANDSNSINIADFSGLNAAFGSVEGDANYNLFADFNCSGTINIADFSGLNAGFGQGGANAPLP